MAHAVRLCIFWVMFTAGMFSISGAFAAQKTMEQIVERWTAPAVSLVSMYENGTFSEFGSITTDFDCQGLSVGILQWTVGTGSILRLFEGIDDSFIRTQMEDNYADLAILLSTLKEDQSKHNYQNSLSIVRKWQTPSFDEAATAACAARRSRPGTAFAPEKQKLYDHLVGLLESKPFKDRQNELASEKAVCVYRLAQAWNARLLRPENQQFRKYFSACQNAEDALKSIPPEELAALPPPEFSHFVFFYDIVVQTGAGPLSAIQDIAIDASLNDTSARPGSWVLQGRLYSDVKNALGWLSTCWDWADSGVCESVKMLDIPEKARLLAKLRADGDLSEKKQSQKTVLSQHLQALYNAKHWNALLDRWRETIDIPGGSVDRGSDPALTTGRVRLGFASFITAMLSYRTYSVNVMNRKGTLAFGSGCAQGHLYNFNPFYNAVEAGDETWPEALKNSEQGACKIGS
jgi:hypothetical protein